MKASFQHIVATLRNYSLYTNTCFINIIYTVSLSAFFIYPVTRKNLRYNRTLLVEWLCTKMCWYTTTFAAVAFFTSNIDKTYTHTNILLLYSIKTVTVHTIQHHLLRFSSSSRQFSLRYTDGCVSFIRWKSFFFVYFMKRKRIITVHFIEYRVGESDGARINAMSVLIHSSCGRSIFEDMIWLHKYLCYISGYYVGEYADQKLSEFMWAFTFFFRLWFVVNISI